MVMLLSLVSLEGDSSANWRGKRPIKLFSMARRHHDAESAQPDAYQQLVN